MTPATASPYLDLRALAPLAQLRFTTRRRIDGAYSGRHRSRQQGGAGEFVDFREYTGGEDLRRLDWKVFARTGKAFVRLHQDETNLLCTLALDGSGSMGFGGFDGQASKLEYMQYLSTALTHLITQGQDQVGVAVLGEDLGEYCPPSSAATNVAVMQEAIAKLQPHPSTVMAESLRRLFERSKNRGVLMLLSDFLMDDVEDVFAALRLYRQRGWEVVVLHLVHPDEERLPMGAAFRFEGMEDDAVIACTPADIRTEYQKHFAEHMSVVRRLALADGCDYRLASTAVPYLQVLQGFLMERAG